MILGSIIMDECTGPWYLQKAIDMKLRPYNLWMNHSRSCVTYCNITSLMMLVTALHTFVFQPTQHNCWLHRQWTNNTCKSINHLLKLFIDCKCASTETESRPQKRNKNACVECDGVYRHASDAKKQEDWCCGWLVAWLTKMKAYMDLLQTQGEWVSEQFLHGTSAQYRLCSAILLKLYKS